jgi:hypothetical protein
MAEIFTAVRTSNPIYVSVDEDPHLKAPGSNLGPVTG